MQWQISTALHASGISVIERPPFLSGVTSRVVWDTELSKQGSAERRYGTQFQSQSYAWYEFAVRTLNTGSKIATDASIAMRFCGLANIGELRNEEKQSSLQGWQDEIILQQVSREVSLAGLGAIECVHYAAVDLSMF